MGEVRNAHKMLMGQPEVKRPRGRHRRRREDNMRNGNRVGTCRLDVSGSG